MKSSPLREVNAFTPSTKTLLAGRNVFLEYVIQVVITGGEMEIITPSERRHAGASYSP